MRYQALNDGWQFSYAASEPWAVRTPAKETWPVTLPHDFQLELPRGANAPGGASEAYYPTGIGYYERMLTVDKETAEGRVFLYIDGAYRLTRVRMNRELLAVHKGGYTGFWVDLTGRLLPGDNLLILSVDAGPSPASRWYTGAGLTRGVALLTGGLTAFSPWGISVETKTIADTGAALAITANAEGPQAADCTVRYTVVDTTGKAAATTAGAPGQTVTVSLIGARLWSPDSPALYTLRAELLQNGQTLDTEILRFGVRTVAADARQGLLLNGKPVKLKGGCVHHDNGALGARSHPDAEARKVRLLKESGYNAVRCAHNPPASSFLDACDEQGMLVIDEAFDCWREGKRQFDGHLFFEELWEAELSAMVLRDRNHPSVILWSTGNEVLERSGISDGALWANRLAEAVRRLDKTRPLTNAVCGFFEDPVIAEMAANSLSTAGEGKDYWAERSEAFLAPLDVAGYNYLLNRYEKDRRLFPSRLFLGTESFPMQALENWQAVEKLPYLLGDFVWTAWDYLGEAGLGHSAFGGPATGLKPYPWHLAWCGDLDICGGKRPQSHYRDFVWTDRVKPYLLTQHPARFGQEETVSPWGWPEGAPSWTYPGFEEKPVQVTVYARGDEVELFLNGESMGRKPAGEANKFTAAFTVSYRAGTLQAVAYENGQAIGEAALVTAGMPYAVAVTPETAPEKTEIGGLLYVRLAVTDANGTVVPATVGEITVSAEGAQLYALGCANPQGEQTYLASAVTPYQGHALAVLRRTGDRASLTVHYTGLQHATTDIIFGEAQA